MSDIYDEYRVPPHGCGTAIGGAILMIVLGVLLLFGMSSCKSQCVPELIETHDTIVRVDSFYTERVRDSIVYRDRQDSTYIYEKDSVSEKQKGDTIFLTKWKVKHQYVYQSLTNSEQTTSSNTQTSSSSDKEKTTEKEVIVKTERYIPGFYKFTMWAFWIAVVLLLVKIAAWVMEKIPATAPWVAIVRKFVPFL